MNNENMDLPIAHFLEQQYHLIKSSRAALFEYCSTLDNADFIAENSSFGKVSIRNLLVHIANAYQAWIGLRSLKKDLLFTEYEQIASMTDTRLLFDETDGLMDEFIELVKNENPPTFEFEREGGKTTASPLTLFTHVITHEFHHKGQLLSLSRHLGYIPIDTDVIR